ncbi:MAG: YicC/YloC family endoribonuclease [Alphaproteobacteria bacterium]|nr:YicC/YloC family endoribonuclease [Alphaproteobacteria bacterium]
MIKPAVPLLSMTAFAQAAGTEPSFAWRWEVRSVNARGLDLRVRLPQGCERLEPTVRDRLSKVCVRGAVSATLEVRRLAGARPLQINAEAIARVLALHQALVPRVDPSPPRLEALLQVKGVLDASEDAPDSEEEVAQRDALLIQGLDAAGAALHQARADEGARLAAVLLAQIDRIDALVGEAASLAVTQPTALRNRLVAMLADVLAEPQPGQRSIDPQRLEQEVALLAVKADVREELDRLIAHSAQARDLVAAGGAVGRRLDFLAQEFNREANTLTSKSTDTALTRLGIELKTVIDQFREQVQNIE